jgi:hypothetical protein
VRCACDPVCLSCVARGVPRAFFRLGRPLWVPKASAFGLAFAAPNSLMRQDMIWNWMTFALDAARLGRETQEVMVLRLLKIARGGRAAEVEARRMVTEKGVAFAEAAATLASGGSMKKVVRRVRSRVSQNKQRLSRSR